MMNKYRNAHEDLRGYHEKRLQLLQSFFGCDLEKRQAELDAHAGEIRAKGWEENEQYYDIDGEATIRFMKDCGGLINSNKSPFDCMFYAKGKPPKIVRDLSAKYKKKVRMAEEKINQVNGKY